MWALRKMRTFMGVVLFGPGLVIADGGEPAAPNTQPPAQMAPAVSPPMASPAPMWVQMVPVPGNQPYYLMPQSGMMRSVLPQYPAPIAIPPAAPVTWPPFMWVLVPVQAMAPVPAGINYGPVADAPVVELPPPDEVPAATTPEGAMPVPTVVEMDRPATEGKATTDTPVMNALPAPDAKESAAAPAVASEGALMVDYGPVAPTPVVDLLALQQQTAAESVSRPSTPQSARKSTASSSPKPRSAATARPAKKRMCWTNGVVAPCR
jgi:hypothetical protein